MRSKKNELKGVALVFFFFVCLQCIWLALDQRALVVERHFLASAQIAHEWRHDSVGAQYPEHGDISPYPPLLAYWSAPALALAGVNGDVAVLTLLPFAWLLMWSVWKTARLFMPNNAATAAAAMALAFHHAMVIEPNFPPYPLAKEYLLDLPLSAMVACTLFLAIRVYQNNSLRYQISLGLVAGLGALTKVSYPLYAVVIMAAVFTGMPAPRQPKQRWIIPAITALAIAAPWYFQHVPDLIRAFARHEFNPAWAAECGMPPVFSTAGLIFTGRLLLRLMSIPLAIVACIAFAGILILRPGGWRLLAAGALFSLVVILPIWGKSERLLAPLVLFPAIATGLAASLPPQPALRSIATGVCILAAVARITVMNGFLPGSWLNALALPAQSEVAPTRNDWAANAILDDIERHRDKSLLLKVAVPPYLGRFRHSSFHQKAGERGLRMAPESEWNIRSENWLHDLEASEFIVTKTGYQGPARFTPNSDAIASWLKEQAGSTIKKIADYPMPDNTTAVLWHHERTISTWSRLTGNRPREFLAVFGDNIRMLGYEIQRKPEHLELRFQWWCDTPPDNDARLFIQVREGYHNLAKASFTPGSGLYPTALWQPASGLDETYILPLPSTCRAGDFDVWAGWHRRNKRMPVRDSIFPLFIKAVCIGKTRPHCQGALADTNQPSGPLSPIKLPPMPGR